MTTTTVATDSHTAQVARVVERRASRYAARHLLWKLGPAQGVDPVPAVRKCGRVVRTGEGVEVRVSVKDGVRSAGFSGLATCGSVWVCPVCSAKIAAHRQAEIQRAVEAWQERGGAVGLGTFTMRHVKAHRLKTLWDAVTSAWQAVTGGRVWKAEQAVAGSPFAREVKTGKRAGQTVVELRIPTIRVVEVTYGENGWHVHIHTLLFLGGHVDGAQFEELGAGMFRRWSSSLEAGGFSAYGRKVWDRAKGRFVVPGYDVKLLGTGDAAGALGDYFTKNVYTESAVSASYEAARGDLKDAKGGNRTPFGILRGLVAATAGDADYAGTVDVDEDSRVWAEWERSSKGRRQITWSPGLRAMLLPDVEELTDEEIAEQAEGGEVAATLDAGTVRQIMRARADWVVLDAFGRSDADGLALVEVFMRKARDAETHDAQSRARWRRRT